MGNRAVITSVNGWRNGGVGIYLHWNGGRDSVEAFLEYCRLRGFRSVEDSYGMARLCQIITNFFGGGLSVGIGTLWHLDYDNGDNGLYVVNEKWEIVERYYTEGPEQDEIDRVEMLCAIDSAQPADDRLGEEFLRAPEIKTNSIAYHDEVWVPQPDGSYYLGKVVGFGNQGRMVNGNDVSGVPFVDIYSTRSDPSQNINNYLLGEKYRVKI